MRPCRRWVLTPMLCLSLGSACTAPTPAGTTPSTCDDKDAMAAHTQPASSRHDGPRVVDFQPAVRIDYSTPHVEVDAKIILRQGQLELFAYSKAPTPKEHETILLLAARPLHIYQALGLIGLVPGKPLSHNWETNETTLPSGDGVDVLVRYKVDGRDVERSACDWMRDAARDRPMETTHWLFTGSARDAKGRFRADIDGTVVTIVNFDTSLLSLPDSHSESNADLWLVANTEAIPSVGTRVTLILRPASKVP